MPSRKTSPSPSLPSNNCEVRSQPLAESYCASSGGVRADGPPTKGHPMTIRTSNKTVTFRRPFVLGGFDEVLPAGAYFVETDEELLEGISFSAYRRKLTLMHLPAKSGNPNLTRTLPIDPNELDAALLRDQAPAEMPADTGTGQKTLEIATESRRERCDRQAVERSENEGMYP